ncbi:MAG: prepilin-type N-terminal cleavage/methylation domain-containing protein [Candidatus Eisenbacteria bacterium]|nr:prepilin-type N-terminal cleavage/methylation domain-containing protein [Candidatus Eisenbacteria bacterium]
MIRHLATSRTQGGFTITELLVASIIAGVILLAVMSIYLTSMQAWDRSGARLALQRRGDLAMERIVSDIRDGSRVEITNGGTTMAIYRATASGDSLVGNYLLVDDELKNGSGTVLAEGLTELAFTSGNGVKVRIEMSLYDNAGTPTLTTDDESIQLETVAVCRNRSLY